MVSMRNKKNYPSIIIKYSSYLELCKWERKTKKTPHKARQDKRNAKTSSEPSQWDGSDEGSQHMVSVRSKKNYPSIIIKYSSYLELCKWERKTKKMPHKARQDKRNTKTSSEPSQWDGSEEGSQHMVSMRNKKNYPSIIIKYSSYLELCKWEKKTKKTPHKARQDKQNSKRSIFPSRWPRGCYKNHFRRIYSQLWKNSLFQH